MYLDELIILNFIIDYLLLDTLRNLLKINISKKRIILASLVGEISLIFLFVNLNNYVLTFIKILLCLIMILVCFGFNDYKTLIKNTVYYYLMSFFLGGSLFYLREDGLIKYKYCLFLIPIIINIYKYFEYDLKKILNTRYKVTIYLNNGKILYLNGYMDSGNELIEPYSNKKVIIINQEVDENYYLVPYSTINNTSLIKCFNPKKVYIDGIGERKDISVGVVNKKFVGYNCLLNYKLMEE
ncbi:MAG: sigma-E processing peptidase SpoIIGA [bacterium]|nr:sigma-E processing peptidase SpoIIGA [bacterium]